MKHRSLVPVALVVLFLAYPLYTAPDKPPQEVAVTNFPVDAEGNLLIARELPFRFVGVTTQRFDGAGGWAAMTTACFDEHGGRMAFSEEYRLSVNPPPIPELAWIQPHPTFRHGGLNSVTQLLDEAGNGLLLSSLSEPPFSGWDCLGWTALGGGGAVLETTGRVLSNQGCGVQRPVACAAQ